MEVSLWTEYSQYQHTFMHAHIHTDTMRMSSLERRTASKWTMSTRMKTLTHSWQLPPKCWVSRRTPQILTLFFVTGQSSCAIRYVGMCTMFRHFKWLLWQWLPLSSKASSCYESNPRPLAWGLTTATAAATTRQSCSNCEDLRVETYHLYTSVN